MYFDIKTQLFFEISVWDKTTWAGNANDSINHLSMPQYFTIFGTATILSFLWQSRPLSVPIRFVPQELNWIEYHSQAGSQRQIFVTWSIFLCFLPLTTFLMIDNKVTLNETQLHFLYRIDFECLWRSHYWDFLLPLPKSNRRLWRPPTILLGCLGYHRQACSSHHQIVIWQTQPICQ